jgi:hypothetical protein
MDLVWGLIPANSIKFLNIDNTGKVTNHEGRHRAALLQNEGAKTIPVVISIKEQPQISRLEDVINNPFSLFK